jgi:hypothetical protein
VQATGPGRLSGLGWSAEEARARAVLLCLYLRAEPGAVFAQARQHDCGVRRHPNRRPLLTPRALPNLNVTGGPFVQTAIAICACYSWRGFQNIASSMVRELREQEKSVKTPQIIVTSLVDDLPQADHF